MRSIFGPSGASRFSLPLDSRDLSFPLFVRFPHLCFSTRYSAKSITLWLYYECLWRTKEEGICTLQRCVEENLSVRFDFILYNKTAFQKLDNNKYYCLIAINLNSIVNVKEPRLLLYRLEEIRVGVCSLLCLSRLYKVYQKLRFPEIR